MSVVGSRGERRLTGILGPLIAMGVAVAALICGYIGLDRFPVLAGVPRINLIYYDIQLFVLSSPPVDDHHSFPVFLEIARFAAPFVTVYTLIEAGRRVFATELALMRIRRARDHDIVCGSDAVADAVAERLIREGRWVLRIAGPGRELGNHRGSRVLPGDPTAIEVLQAAGTSRARALYACTNDSAVNLAVAIAVSGLPRRAHRVLDVHVQVDDPELCLALQARRLGLPSSTRLHVNFFSSHELAARTLIRTHAPPDISDRPARFMIVGASPFGMALIVELARHWRASVHSVPDPLEIVLVDPHAADEIERLCRRYTFPAHTCRFTSYDVEVDTLLDGDLPEDPPDQVYLCNEDEEAALRLALTMDQFWHRGPRTVVVRLNRLGPLEQAFHSGDVERLLDDVSGALYLFDAVRAGSDADLVKDSLVERLGRALHENYVESRLRAGTDPDASVMLTWNDLSEDIRAANRAQAADVGRKLRAVGCVLAPSPIWRGPAVLDKTAIELLARMEHERWCDYMRAHDWHYAPVRDNVAKHHPEIIDWDDASEEIKEKNRDTVREIPTFLSDAGFQIVQIADDDPTDRLL